VVSGIGAEPDRELGADGEHRSERAIDLYRVGLEAA